MKKRVKQPLEIFNLSFLDIISCGFGAVVLLVLISNSGERDSGETVSTIESLLHQVASLEQSINNLKEEIDSQKKQNDHYLTTSGSLGRASDTLHEQLSALEEEEQTLDGDLAVFSLVQKSLKRISITPTTATSRDEEVGGIPVDADYIIFVVDTSGSMQEIWDWVAKEVLHVLDIHPQVSGFQVISDQGKPLISGYDGRWIPDSPKRRQQAMKIFGNWQGASNSNPVQGIETALRKYAKPGQATAIYVFGDDYSGGDFDTTIATITRQNHGTGGERHAKIHGIGFISEHTTNRYAILMRELTKQNGGSFIGLNLKDFIQ